MGFFNKLLSVFSSESSYSSNGSGGLDGSNHYKLGLSYYKRKNYKKALDCFKNAAKYGNINAQFYLGRIFFEGTGVSQDYSLAFTWFKQAAELGDKNAQFYLGRMYETGKGVHQDKLQAIEWYHKSALQEHDRARNSYNRLQQQQSQGGYDYEGQHNNNSIENSIGKKYDDEAFAYEYGFGRPVNADRAMEMYKKALAAGFQPARDGIERLQKQRSEVRFGFGERHNINNPTPVIKKQQINVTNTTVNNDYQKIYIKAQNSKLLFDQAVEFKRKGQYQAALMLYKKAYEAFPDDPDLQSVMYAMAKIYLILGDYEKSCALFQDSLTLLLAKDDKSTSDFYDYYSTSRATGTFNAYDPRYMDFRRKTDSYTIFIGLTHILLCSDANIFLQRYGYDFNEHIKEVKGQGRGNVSDDYLGECFKNGWIRTTIIASESMDRCHYKMDSGKVQKRKQEFLDILETIS